MKRLFILLPALLFPGTAQAFDCAKATTKVEVAICADPALKAADDAMSTAYAEIRALSSADEKKALTIAQKDWVADRERDCVEKDAANISCIRDRIDEWRKRLLAEPKSGPGAPSRMMAIFVQREGTRKLPKIDYELVRFADPKSAGEKRFNREVEKIAKSAAGPNEEESPADMIYEDETTIDVDYASPRLISASVLNYSFLGGAHPNTNFTALNVDLKTGRLVTYADMFEKAGLAPLTAECRKQIVAEKTERADGEVYNPADDPELKDETIRDRILHIDRWWFTAEQGTVEFGSYDIGAYAEGTFSCDFPIAMLRTYAKPDGPLPK
ncbi:hypothetical protein BH10PSE7_BH10PSE7_19620 [soil metagenome]